MLQQKKENQARYNRAKQQNDPYSSTVIYVSYPIILAIEIVFTAVCSLVVWFLHQCDCLWNGCGQIHV